MGRDEFYQYILDNFTLSGEAARLVNNILQYVEMPGVAENEQYHMLSCLLYGICWTASVINMVYL